MKYKIQFWLLMTFVKIINFFPEKSRFKFAEFIGELTYNVVKKRRITTLANLKLAFPEKKQEELEKIAIESYKIIFKAFLSTIWFDKYLTEPGKVSIYNKESLDSCMKEGKGAIAVCMHMGNMEASLKIGDYYPVVTVAKKQRNPYIDNYITENRKKLNVTLLKRSRRTAAELIENLDRNKIIALFSDHRDNGTDVVFFGKETVAPTGAISLALKNDVPLFITYNILNPDNTSSLFISDEIPLIKTGSYKEDVKINMQNLINNMEDIIRKHPEQWMWFHDRWNIYKDLKKNK